MANTSLAELGPVDYVVVEFPAGASNFTGEMAAELIALVDAGTIRVIDVLILTKNEDGSVEATELSDVDELGELQALEAELAELLAEDDVVHLAAAMEPGSTAGVLIWENLWAAPFASAARRSGGQLIANGRIPIQAIIASIEADEASRKETDHAAETSTSRTSRRDRPPGREDRGRGQGRHARARRRSRRPRSSPPPSPPDARDAAAASRDAPRSLEVAAQEAQPARDHDRRRTRRCTPTIATARPFWVSPIAGDAVAEVLAELPERVVLGARG